MVILCGCIVVVSLTRIVGAGATLHIKIVCLASSIIVARSRGTGGPQGRFVGLGRDHDGCGGYPRNNTRGIVRRGNGRDQRETRDPELGAVAVVVAMISLWDARCKSAESNDGRKSRDVVAVWGRLGGL